MILKDLVFMHSPFSPHHQPAEPEDTVTLYDVFQGAIPYGVAWDLNVRMLNCEYLIALQTKAQEYKLWYRRCLQENHLQIYCSAVMIQSQAKCGSMTVGTLVVRTL